MRLTLGVAMLCLTAACRCDSGIVESPPPDLTAQPATLRLPITWLGQTSEAKLVVKNSGGRIDDVPVTIDLPFATVTKTVNLGRGGSAEVTVEFSPDVLGLSTATLRIGTLLEVAVEGQARQPPPCDTPVTCHSMRFDIAAGQCVESALPDGTSCQTSCVMGACVAGECKGQLLRCNDADACTVDLCSESEGCSHAPVMCPAVTSPCKLSVCDPATGCGAEDVTDGTLCGPDDCTATTVDLCLSGQCVQRPRPATGRCSNRWVVTTPPPRAGVAAAYDAEHQRVVVFGGGDVLPRGDTWELFGTRWVERIPVASPSARSHHAMVYDAARKRVVLFGGDSGGAGGIHGDTWEWDGTNWLQRFPAVSPPARKYHTMAYDSARRRVVLFGGYSGTTVLSDTWEFNGLTWVQRTTATAPRSRMIPAMAYDETRQRVVLHGGYDPATPTIATTWEWDGTTWERRAPATELPYRYSVSSMAYDAARKRIVLFGADLSTAVTVFHIWEYDGATWAQVLEPVPSAPPRYFAGVTYDAARQQVVVFGGSWGPQLGDTWGWNGADWSQLTAFTPPPRVRHGLTYDGTRRRVVLFGGFWSAMLNDTWEWDGSTWLQKTPPGSPGRRSGSMLAYDALHQRVVLFGGALADAGVANDTWEWDGSGWAQRSPLVSPPGRYESAMAYDTTRQRMTLFGGVGGDSSRLGDTWEWDGTTWLDRSPDAGPGARQGHTLVYDTTRQRVQLFGGSDDDGGVHHDVWEWDGAAWAQLPLTMPPEGRVYHGAAYDHDRGRTVLFGGWSGAGPSYSDTWELDGSSWLQRTPLTSPTEGAMPVMTYDAARKRVVMVSDSNTWLFLP
ncbi:MAG: hypothetical protein JNK82_13140 [Myxococcaceae bacterium]|nr:hypothetical protein [Myxococcaceae bacterium]